LSIIQLTSFNMSRTKHRNQKDSAPKFVF
jgi:hypothetical protein